MFLKGGGFRIVQGLQSAVVIDENGILHFEFVNFETMLSATIIVQDVMYNAKKGDKNGLCKHAI